MNENYLERKKRDKKSLDEIDISINILFILKEIKNNPLYPYAIKKIILSKYNVDIPIQSIYTTIKKYEKIKYVKLHHVDANKKKFYILSSSGEQFFEEKSNLSKQLVKKLCEV